MSETPKSPFHLKLASGAVAGILGTIVIFPIDLIKTRLQNQGLNAIHKNGIECLKHVIRYEGFRGLYRGLLPNLIGVTPEKAIKLAINDAVRAQLSLAIGVKESELPIYYGMLAGATAGLCQVLVTNPMEIVKIKMQIAGVALQATTHQRVSLMTVVQGLGLKGLYYGIGATLMRDIPFSILFFSSFALFKQHLIHPGEQVTTLPFVFLSGILAGILSAVLATPMDVVKTRLQAMHERGEGQCKRTQRLLPLYKDIYVNEGPKAFFKGSIQRCCIISPLFGISLLVYEIQQRWIQRLY